MGHLAAVDYPDGNEAIYDYTDGAVADVRIEDGINNFTYGVTGVTYRPMDLAMSGWTAFNYSASNSITYDSDMRPTSITASGIESLAFTYDAANRITRITNGMDATLSQTLGYDALNRLTSESASAENESYQYDADGNRTYQVINGMPTSFTYPSGSNRLESSAEPGAVPTSYGYNADGDITTVGGHTAYTYGAFNRLVNVGGTSYVISAEGQRLEKTSASGTTYFLPEAGGTLQAEQDNGTWVDYVWLNGRLVTTIINGGIFPIYDDQTGRPLYVNQAYTHAVIWAAQNLPFTRNVITNSFWQLNVGFPGQYYDSESGLWHNGYRDYDASLGRYIESDPIGMGGGINTYAYVGNNPISEIDPLGLCGCTRLQKIAAELGSMYGTESEVTGTLAAGGFAATLVSGGLEAPTLGGDTPVTAGLGFASGLLATSSATSGLLSAALNAYAGGGITSFRGYAAEEVSDFAMKLTASSVPGAAKAADLLGSLAGKIMGSATRPPPPPCQQQ